MNAKKDKATGVKTQEWSYKKSVAKAMLAFSRWKLLTAEIIKMLYEEKEMIASQKEQSKNHRSNDYVPDWRTYCKETSMPKFFSAFLDEYILVSDFRAREKEERLKKRKGVKV